LDEEGGDVVPVPAPEPGDGAVVGAEPAGDDAVGGVGDAALLDTAGGPFPVAVGVEQQGGHHGRVVGGPAFPVGAVGAQERGGVEFLEDVDEEVDEMVPG
jgi:hypothetical protein